MTYEFANFRVDTGECVLLQDGRPVPLTPKAFDTLLLLVENSGRLLEKEAMMERLWPGTFVEEANLANNISLLRKALGDQANLIQTVPRRGYRFIGEVRTIGDALAVVPPVRRRWPLAAAGAILLAAAGGLMLGRYFWHNEPPAFRQITFRRGIISNARFEPDGQTILYSASHEGRPAELFVTRADQRESRPLGIAGDLLAVSRHGYLAILTKSEMLGFLQRGTLARVPLTGGAPRELADNVQEADWMPDGGSLAVIRWEGLVARVEFPLGHVICKSGPPVWFDRLRVSASGDEVAFLLHESQRFDDRGRAVVADRTGRIVRTSRLFTSTSGLAWSGERLRIGASIDDLNNGVVEIDRRGHDRVLTRSAGRLKVFDVAASGAVLVSNEEDRTGILALAPGETVERDLSWLDGSWIRDISADGHTLLFDEEGSGGGATAHVYTRTIDGAPAVDLGEGHAVALSPDGRWVLARQRFTNPPRLILFRTGAGESKPVRTGNVEPAERASWMPDGRGILFAGRDAKRPLRTYLYDIDSGRVAAVTPEGVVGTVATPDGTYVFARSRENVASLFPIAGGAPRPIAAVQRDEFAMRFSDDALLTSTETTISRVDLKSGAREVVRTFGAMKPPGCVYVTPAHVSADGRAYAYTYATSSSELFVIEGAK